VERTFDAPVAWSEPHRQGGHQQGPSSHASSNPVVGFESSSTSSTKASVFHRCKVTEVIPTRAAYTWRYEGHPGDSVVTFGLFAEGARPGSADARRLETFPSSPRSPRRISRQAGRNVGTSLKNSSKAGTRRDDPHARLRRAARAQWKL